jgi:hypothetical protein
MTCAVRLLPRIHSDFCTQPWLGIDRGHLSGADGLAEMKTQGVFSTALAEGTADIGGIQLASLLALLTAPFLAAHTFTIGSGLDAQEPGHAMHECPRSREGILSSTG